MIKTVYHGTTLKSAKNIKANGVDLTVGRKNLDFGQGFYTTANKGQAVEWANRVSYGTTPAIVAFRSEFDGLNVKRFPYQNDEWKIVVYQNRVLGIDLLNEYDCIMGPMADGEIQSLVLMMRSFSITKEKFFDKISKGIGNQIVYKTKKSLNYLVMDKILEV